MSSARAHSARPFAAPSRFILDRVRDLGLLIAAPVWIIPLAYGIAALTTDRAVNEWVLALGGMGHHLPGMMRAYGDRALLRRFRARFVIAPLVLAGFGIASAWSDLHAIVLIAFVWGVWHGLMQTYGFARIYGSREGAGERLDAQLDFALLFTWFVAAVAFSPLRTTFMLDMLATLGVPLPDANALATVRLVVATSTAAATVAWLANAARARFAGRSPGPLRVLLIVTSIAFWWFANVRVRHLLLAMPLFEIFHDLQYLAIVWAFNRRRVDTAAGELRPSLRWLFAPTVTAAITYVAMVAAYGSLSFLSSSKSFGELFTGLFAASQLLHFYYDGFIWKVREPSTGAALGVAPIARARTWAPGPKHALLWGSLAVAAVGLGIGERTHGLPFLQRIPLVAPLVPENPMIQFSAAELHWEHGDAAEALDGFRRVLAIDPDSSAAKNNLALSLVELAERAASTGDAAGLASYSDELRHLRPSLSGEFATLTDARLARFATLRTP